eukprot:946911-Rhodomonas_salina.8
MHVSIISIVATTRPSRSTTTQKTKERKKKKKKCENKWEKNITVTTGTEAHLGWGVDQIAFLVAVLIRVGAYSSPVSDRAFCYAARHRVDVPGASLPAGHCTAPACCTLPGTTVRSAPGFPYHLRTIA